MIETAQTSAGAREELKHLTDYSQNRAPDPKSGIGDIRGNPYLISRPFSLPNTLTSTRRKYSIMDFAALEFYNIQQIYFA